MRVACLLLPDLPLATALRCEPELHDKPVAIVENARRGGGPVILCGHLRGLDVAQARSLAPDLVVRTLSLEGMHSTQEALLDLARSISPQVQETAAGRVHIDLRGTESLFPTERGLRTALESRAHDLGLRTLRIGIGPTRTIAELAARYPNGGTIVATGDRQRFLAPLPLDLLDPGEDLVERLERWGIRTLGQLAALPRQALGTRLGEAGVRLARRARGEDLSPFQPTLPQPRFTESWEPDCAVTSLEALGFCLRGVLDRLSRRLRLRGLAVRALRIELTLESGASHARDVELGAPTTETPVLLSLLRLALEKDPPRAAVEQIRVLATPGSVDSAQLDLFRPPLPAPAELAVTIARLEALCGPEQIGAPGCRDTHRLDEAHLRSFRTRPRPVRVRSRLPALPTLALRALRPPLEVRVREREGIPEGVELRGRPLRVRHHAGPWRLFGEWWGESCFARDYFDIELSDHVVYRLYRNLRDERWFIDGHYD
ncbi:MAG: hypothetical protein ACE5FG_09085 [Myxococcota bacterium]